jgi:hypothetical protein
MTHRTKQVQTEEKRAAPQHAHGEPAPVQSQAAAHPATLLRHAGAYGAALAPRDVLQLQRTLGNRAVGGLLAGAGGRVQRVAMSGGSKATVDDVKKWASDNGVELELSDGELESELEQEEGFDEEIDVEDFLRKIGALNEAMDDAEDDEDWDPADYAADPLDPDDILSSDVRKSLGFKADAKNYMKIDTPKKNGVYVCHICGLAIGKGQDVDMDHLPPWKERLHAYIKEEGLTEDDTDELTGPLMSYLYNMRGSVFAHSSCNRGHSGEGNYKKKWGTARKWYQAGGGAPF